MDVLLVSVDTTIAMLGLRDIASVMKEHGHRVVLLSMPNTGVPYSPAQMAIYEDLAGQFGLVGVTSFAINQLAARQVLEAAKRKGALTVWGGVHATLFPAECANFADLVCVGEGEYALLDVADRLQRNANPRDVANMGFLQSDGTFTLNRPRPPLQDLDGMPFPDYDLAQQLVIDGERLLSAGEYLSRDRQLMGRDNYMYIYSSRGCSHSCTYCSNSKLNDIYPERRQHLRRKSISRLIAEVERLSSILEACSKVWIVDDSFLARTSGELAEFNEQWKIKKPLDFFACPNMITESKLRALKDVNISLVRVGVQSGSENTLKNVYNRPISSRDALRCSEIIERINQERTQRINVVYQFIINNPYESADDIRETIRLVLALRRPCYLSMFFLVFFPGSRLTDRARGDGLEGVDNWDQEFLAENVAHHLKGNTPNLYLNSLCFWLHGYCGEFWIGKVPRLLVPLLLSRAAAWVLGGPGKGLVRHINRWVAETQEPLVAFLERFNRGDTDGHTKEIAGSAGTPRRPGRIRRTAHAGLGRAPWSP